MHAFRGGITAKAAGEVSLVHFDTTEYVGGRVTRVVSTLGRAIALTLFLAVS